MKEFATRLHRTISRYLDKGQLTKIIKLNKMTLIPKCHCLTFLCNDIEDIQKTMEDILLSKDKLNELSALGLKHSKKFNWQYCAKETLNIYKKLY